MVLPARMARSWGSQAGFDNGLTRVLGDFVMKSFSVRTPTSTICAGFFFALKMGSSGDRHRGKQAVCTAVGILADPFSLLSIYKCPATNITAAKIITNIALANWWRPLILLTKYPTAICETERWTCSCNWPAPFILPPAARTRRVAALRRPPRQPGQAETEAY